MLETYDSRLDAEDAGDKAHGWPQEVRKLLFEANQEASALRSERRNILARVAELERRLAGANTRIAELSGEVAQLEQERRQVEVPTARPADEQWLHDVTDRTTTALRSSQELAQSVTERAHQRATEIEESALREAAAIRRRAEAQAAKILNVAQYDAEGLLQAAQSSAEELLKEAHKQQKEVAARLRRRRETLQQEIDRLEVRRLRLLETYAAIRRPVEEAIRTLEQGAERPPAPPEVPLATRIRNARSTWARRDVVPAASQRRPTAAPGRTPTVGRE